MQSPYDNGFPLFGKLFRSMEEHRISNWEGILLRLIESLCRSFTKFNDKVTKLAKVSNQLASISHQKSERVHNIVKASLTYIYILPRKFQAHQCKSGR